MKQPVVSRSRDIMGGAAVFAGTRVPVQTLLDYLEAGESIDEFLAGFPSVTRQQAIAFLEQAKDRTRQIRLVKVLLDECIDWRLSRDIVGHEVRTAHQMGWTTIKNGELLVLASEHFDVFVTVDRNLSFQQNLGTFSIAVIVLSARTNRLAELKPLVPSLLAVIKSAKPGNVKLIT